MQNPPFFKYLCNHPFDPRYHLFLFYFWAAKRERNSSFLRSRKFLASGIGPQKMSPNHPKNAPKCIFAFFSVACTLKGKTTYCVILGFSIDFFVLFNTSPLPITSDHLIFACDPPNWDNFWQFWKDSPGDLWHLRHWLQFWQLRTWMHDNLWYQTINCDTGQHSQFLRCSLTKPSNSHKGNEL